MENKEHAKATGGKKKSDQVDRSEASMSQIQSTEETPLIPAESSGHITELKMDMKEWLRQISIPVYILVMLFAISSWVDINGLWVELPLLVNELPEGWSLPSYLAVIIQVANVGPLLYTVAHKLAPNGVKEWPVICLIISVGAASCLLLAFSWRHTSYIGDTEHSVALIVLSSCLALVDCTSSVVFLPYMGYFKPQYMTALYIGEGLSGFIPGVVGLIQSVSSDPECVNKTVPATNTTNGTDWEIVPVYPKPLFSVEVFFFFLCSMLLVSGIAFCLLQWLPYCRRERIQTGTVEAGSQFVSYEQAYSIENDDHDNSTSTIVKAHDLKVINNEGNPQSEKDVLGRCRFIALLSMTAWLNAIMNGLIASLQSYSALPYGSLSYTLAVRLSALANPLACFLALFVVCRSVRLVTGMTLTATALAGYQIYLAAMSPYPPLVGTAGGEFLVITTAVLLSGVASYVKVTIASLMHGEGRKALLCYGILTQVGSFVGAILAFVLVNVLHVFQSLPPCSQ